jgi:hypothetical protein
LAYSIAILFMSTKIGPYTVTAKLPFRPNNPNPFYTVIPTPPTSLHYTAEVIPIPYPTIDLQRILKSLATSSTHHYIQ